MVALKKSIRYCIWSKLNSVEIKVWSLFSETCYLEWRLIAFDEPSQPILHTTWRKTCI